MIQEIKKILKNYTNKEIVFNEAHNELCDLHNAMLRDRNRWRLFAWCLMGAKAIDIIIIYTN